MTHLYLNIIEEKCRTLLLHLHFERILYSVLSICWHGNLQHSCMYCKDVAVAVCAMACTVNVRFECHTWECV